MFTVGSEYTRDQIHQNLGGSKQSYLPTVAGAVVAACVKPQMNPRAPHVILCGKGPVIAAAGATLARQTELVPVFIKRGVNRWQFHGNFRVVAAHSCGSQFSAFVAGSGRQESDVSLAIQLA